MAEYYNKPKEVKVAEVVRYLNRAFSRAVSKAAGKIGLKATRTINNFGGIETTTMYDYQVEFCYLMDKIQRGPEYIAPKVIQEVNDLIVSLEAEG